MAKAISYALFGYNKEKHKDCFPFASYMRGFAISLRMCRLIYPDWRVILNIDMATCDAFPEYFNGLIQQNICDVEVNKDAPLCLSMLWRLKPIFKRDWDDIAQGFTGWTYSHVICRDLDSPVTYKEAQAVKVWIDNDKAMNAITDSDSHSIPLMGGMIGFKPAYITEKLQSKDFDEMMRRFPMELNQKGSDQTWLNTYIYPLVAQHGNDSITQHYFEGMPKSFLSDYHTCRCARGTGHEENCPNNVKLDISEDLKESNYCTGHIGCSGWYETACFKVFDRYDFSDILEIEKQYKHIFHWA